MNDYGQKKIQSSRDQGKAGDGDSQLVYYVSNELKFRKGILKLTNQYFRFFDENTTDFHGENAVDYVQKKWYFVVGAKEFDKLNSSDKDAVKAFMLEKMAITLHMEKSVIGQQRSYLRSEGIKSGDINRIVEKAQQNVKDILSQQIGAEEALIKKGQQILSEIHNIHDKEELFARQKVSGKKSSMKKQMGALYSENKFDKNEDYGKALKGLYENKHLTKYTSLLNLAQSKFDNEKQDINELVLEANEQQAMGALYKKNKSEQNEDYGKALKGLYDNNQLTKYKGLLQQVKEKFNSNIQEEIIKQKSMIQDFLRQKKLVLYYRQSMMVFVNKIYQIYEKNYDEEKAKNAHASDIVDYYLNESHEVDNEEDFIVGLENYLDINFETNPYIEFNGKYLIVKGRVFGARKKLTFDISIEYSGEGVFAFNRKCYFESRNNDMLREIVKLFEKELKKHKR